MSKSDFDELVEYVKKEYGLNLISLNVSNKTEAIKLFTNYLALNY